VRDRLGAEIAATVDEFDYFDAARLCLTYDVRWLFVVTPVPAQRELAARLVRHGAAADREESRGVFDRTLIVEDLHDLAARAQHDAGSRPVYVATTARSWPDAVPWSELARRSTAGTPLVLLFGKAWGLTDTVVQAADVRAQPFRGPAAYNHLSVRSALAIALDRLRGS
jgi:tRNA (guanine37-N1)-methyltransferase